MITPLLNEHAPQCVEVVRTLPEWFGYPGAFEDIKEATSSQRGFVVPDDDGRVLGFVTVQSTFAETLEITYLAVRANHRRSGLGRELVHAVRDLAKERGVESICLLTLGPSANSPHYHETVAFYCSIGFWQTKELYLTAWGGAPTLLMVADVDAIR